MSRLKELYNNTLDKIAIRSNSYKSLYNKYSSFIITHKHIHDIDRTLKYTKIDKLIDLLVSKIPGGISSLNCYDSYIVRMSEPNDLLLVSDEIEKEKVREEQKYFSGTGQVLTIEDLYNPNTKINTPINKIYIFSSIWLKDLFTIRNLIYILENEKEGVKLWFI